MLVRIVSELVAQSCFFPRTRAAKRSSGDSIMIDEFEWPLKKRSRKSHLSEDEMKGLFDSMCAPGEDSMNYAAFEKACQSLLIDLKEAEVCLQNKQRVVLCHHIIRSP